jgi:hypothetical protein
MAVQAFPYLAIMDSSGAPSVVLADGAGGATNAPIIRWGWNPGVPAFNDSPLGPRYVDVVEGFTLNVRGADAAAAMANAQTLAQLLIQAERWRNGAVVNPVIIKFAPQGSTIASTAAPYQALVLGRARGDASALVLGQRFPDVGMLKEILGSKIALLRQGAWLGADETPAASASGANPTIHNVTLTSNLNASPLVMSLGGFSGNAAFPSSCLLVGSGISIAEAEAATAAGFTSVADAANNARGGSVLRYTPVSTAFAATAVISTQSWQRIAIYAAIRNNSAAATFQMYATGTYGVTVVQTPITSIDASTVQPRIVYLGTLYAPPSAFQDIRLHVEAATTTGPPTLDIDYIALLKIDDEFGYALALDPLTFTFAGAHSIVVDHRLLTQLTPDVRSSAAVGGQFYRFTYHGPARMYFAGTTIQATWLATNGASWRYTQAGVVVSTSLTVTRSNAYVTPA